MINKYLEENIKKKIQLCQLLFHNREISVKEISKKIDVSLKKSKTLLGELEGDLKGIGSVEITSAGCRIVLPESVRLYGIFHRIYSSSEFLKCLAFLLTEKGEKPFVDFAEENFITVPTAYRIKSLCTEYLNDIGLDVEKNHVTGDEYRIRILVGLLYYKYGIDCVGFDDESVEVARSFILSTNPGIDKEFLDLTQDEYGYFECLLILMWKRQQYDVDIPKTIELERLKKRSVNKRLIENAKLYIGERVNIEFTEGDYDYLYLIFACTNNCIFANLREPEDFNELYGFVSSDPKFGALIDLFDQSFPLPLKESVIFRMMMIQFYKKCLLNLQCLVPDKEFYFDMNEDELHRIIYRYITQTLTLWREEYKVPYGFEEGHIRYLTVQFANIVRKNLPQVDVFLVSDISSEIDTWEMHIKRTFSPKLINVRRTVINVGEVGSLRSAENSIIIVKNSFEKYVKALGIDESNIIIPLSLEINSIEFKEISESILKCEEVTLQKALRRYAKDFQ